MIAKDEVRDFVVDREMPVYIVAAMVNAAGDERANEWVSIINLSNGDLDLNGWTLSDMRREPLALSTVLKPEELIIRPGQAVRVQPVAPVILSNRNGVITLYEAPTEAFPKGRRIDRVSYTKEQASQEGVPIIFDTRPPLNRDDLAL